MKSFICVTENILFVHYKRKKELAIDDDDDDEKLVGFTQHDET